MKSYKQRQYQKKKKDIQLTHSFYNNLVDSRKGGAIKISRQLIRQGIELPKVLKYLMAKGLKYHESMEVIKDAINEEKQPKSANFKQ